MPWTVKEAPKEACTSRSRRTPALRGRPVAASGSRGGAPPPRVTPRAPAAVAPAPEPGGAAARAAEGELGARPCGVRLAPNPPYPSGGVSGVADGRLGRCGRLRLAARAVHRCLRRASSLRLARTCRAATKRSAGPFCPHPSSARMGRTAGHFAPTGTDQCLFAADGRPMWRNRDLSREWSVREVIQHSQRRCRSNQSCILVRVHNHVKGWA
jgi:hypothetical protein